MGFGMKPLTLELIDEGQFLAELEHEVMKAQEILGDFQQEHGDASEKGTVEVTAKIKFKITNPKEGTVQISTGTQTKRPQRPGSVTTSIQSEDESGKTRLYVKGGGSDGGHPRQTKFATRDGELVAPEPDGKSAASGERESDYEDVAD